MTDDRASENQIQRAAVQWMQFALHPNVIYFAVPNGEHRNIVTASRLKGQGVMRGVADLILLYAGRALCLEMKAPDGRQSEPQRVFEAKCVFQGVPYEICRDLDDVIAACRRHGVPLRADIASGEAGRAAA